MKKIITLLLGSISLFTTSLFAGSNEYCFENEDMIFCASDSHLLYIAHEITQGCPAGSFLELYYFLLDRFKMDRALDEKKLEALLVDFIDDSCSAGLTKPTLLQRFSGWLSFLKHQFVDGSLNDRTGRIIFKDKEEGVRARIQDEL
ncbi:MAG TPA: hypothetical protein DIU37_03990 [Opitutae bacterium]|nr:hypothetical protein [Opitutae bacterium]|tara:strand:+ start:140 stop:577 length:438 start_codon:yes stop_codon:yes gene_type:complete